MSGAPQSSVAEVSEMARIEDQLATVLDETAGEVAHSECLDVEERAEVYTILRTLQLDSRQNRDMLAGLLGQLRGGAANA